jgi:hypothetical protein
LKAYRHLLPSFVVQVCRDPISAALLDLSYDGRPGVTRLRQFTSGRSPPNRQDASPPAKALLSLYSQDSQRMPD